MFTHHAYLIPHRGDETRTRLFEMLRTRGIAVQSNLDLVELSTDVLSVDEARHLTERQLRKSLGETPQIFIVFFNHMTHEAQNALLKVLEDPTPGTIFFLVTPHTHTIVPTLLSRLEQLVLDGDTGRVSQISAEAFLDATPNERLALVKPLIEAKDKEGALTLFNDIETILVKEKRRVGVQQTLKDLEELRKYTHDRASSLKLLLESAALLCQGMEARS